MAEDFQLFTSLRYDPALLQVPESGLEYAGWNLGNKSPLYMLDLHRDRLLRAATFWGWNQAVEVLSGDSGLKTLEDFIVSQVSPVQNAPLRVKVVVSKEGGMSCETSQTPETGLTNLFPERLPPPGENAQDGRLRLPSKELVYSVVIDTFRTTPSEFTHFKTTMRHMYDTARQRARINLPDNKEALLVNDSSGSLMEGTLTTPYLWRGGRWVTPPVGAQFRRSAGSGGQDGTTRRWMLER